MKRKGTNVAKTKSNAKKNAKTKTPKKSNLKTKAKTNSNSKTASKKSKPALKTASKTASKPAVKANSNAKTNATKSVSTKSKAIAKSVVSALPAKFQPLGDRVLVQIQSSEKMSAGGLYIPDTVVDVSGNIKAHVVAVGQGHTNKKGHLRPMDVQIGDTVLVADYAGEKVQINSQEYRVLHETDILGIQEGK